MSQTYEDRLTLEAWNGKLGRIPLMTCTVEEESRMLDLDLTDVDWGSYMLVHIRITPTANYDATLGADLVFAESSTLKFTDFVNASEWTWTYGLVRNSLKEPVSIYLIPNHSAHHDIYAVAFGAQHVCFAYGRQHFEEIRSLHLWTDDPRFLIPVGTTIRLTGIG